MRLSFWLPWILAWNALAQDGDAVKIQVYPNEPLNPIAGDFIGFGYETSAVAQSNFFSAGNAAMIQLYRNLSLRGLIRVGGNVSDHTRFAPDAPAAARTEREVTVINRTNLADLGGFARATGWNVMWGLNLGSGTKEDAAREALAVAAALGSHLQSFEIGNEVEALRRFHKSYQAYHAAFLDYKEAIRAALPRAPFSGPDSIGNLNWITNFAAEEGPGIKLLTQHYYRGGAGDSKSTVEKLLQRDEGWERRLVKLGEICQEHGLRFRINEVNSYSGGGKPGVSDTFASALWCLDYMFLLASHGAEGVNMETDVNQLGFISHYSPIAHDAQGHCAAKPEYYGMLAFAMSGTGEMVRSAMDKTEINLSSYATRDKEGAIWIIVVNKDFTRDATVETAFPQGYNAAGAFRLRAPAMESTDHVTLAGAEVSPDGQWTPGPPEKVMVRGGAARVPVPHASAVLLRLKRSDSD